jgi:endo-1,4-beta-D-glucanase Y
MKKIITAAALWLGASSLTIAQINTPNNAVVPFNSNPKYDYGIMPTNLPTSGQYGKSQEAANAYLEWKTAYSENCGNGSIRIKFDDPSRTVSEGIAYGMVLAAYAADKAYFDALWKFYKDKSQSRGGMMHWRYNGCNSNDGNGSATDADLDAAFALYIASNQWPSTTSYLSEANTLIGKIKGNDMSSDGQTLNGDSWGNTDSRNPSYQSPAYYKLFATKDGGNATFWNNSAVNASYSLLTANAHPTTGLVSDWARSNGAIDNGQSGLGTASTPGYGYDACRSPFRMAMDVFWYNETRANGFCNKMAAYANGRGATGVGGPVNPNGTNYNGFAHNATFVSTYAMAVMGSSSTYQNLMNTLYTETVNVKDPIQNSSLSGYYGNTLRVLSLFMMTGNFWKYGYSSVQEINIRANVGNNVFAAVPNSSTFDFQNVQQNTAGKSITFTIENLGFANLTLTGGVTTSTCDNGFSVTTQPNSSTLAQNASTTFTVKFAPTSTGDKACTLTVRSNDTDEGTYTIYLNGTGTINPTAPKMVVKDETSNNTLTTPTSVLPFGTISTSSKGIKRFKIINKGDADLNFTSATYTGTGYVVLGVLNATTGKIVAMPTTIGIGDSSYLYIEYTATTTAGTYAGSVSLVTNDAVSPFVFNLTTTTASCAGTLTANGVLYDFDGNRVFTMNYKTPSVNNDTLNPQVNSLNPSNRVGSFKRTSAGEYSDQIRYRACGGALSFTSNRPYVSMLVYSPVVGADIQINLKNEAGIVTPYPSLFEGKAKTTVANKWHRVYFDFSNAVGSANTVIYFELFIDPLNTKGKQTYFYDDIRFESAPPCLAGVQATGVLQDFDNNSSLSERYNDPKNRIFEYVANPSKTGINTSNLVGKYARSQPKDYAIIRYATCGKLDLSAGKTTISMKVFSPKQGVTIEMNMSNVAFNSNYSDPTTVVASKKVRTTRKNEWEELFFDFSSVQGNTTVNAIDIFFDPNRAATPLSDSIFYYDDIKYATLPSCVANIINTNVLNDFDSNRNIDLEFLPRGTYNDYTANPSTVGNPSAGVARFVSGTTKPDSADILRYRSCSKNVVLEAGRSVLSLDVYAPNAQTEVIVSLKKANGTTEVAKSYAKMTKVNQWETVTFDFSNYVGNIEAAFLDVILDPNGKNIANTTAKTYYIDNLRYSQFPEINVKNGTVDVLSGVDTVKFTSSLIGDSLSKGLLVLNNGGAGLELNGSPTFKITGAHAADFKVTTPPNFTTTVTSGTATGITVVFIPTGAGKRNAVIEIKNNDLDEPTYFVALQGLGSCPTVTAQASPAGPLAVCSNQTPAILSASPTTGVTYQWKDALGNILNETGATYAATATGDYSVVVTKGAGCSYTSNVVKLTVSPLPTVTTSADQTNAAGPTVNLSVTASATGTWSVVSGPVTTGIIFAPSAASTTVTASGLTQIGNYVFRYTIASGAPCGSVFDETTVNISTITGIGTTDYFKNSTGVAIYPNPVSEALTIDLSDLKGTLLNLKITDMLGTTVFESTNSNGQLTIPTSHFTSGLYVVHVKTSLGSATKSILKR